MSNFNELVSEINASWAFFILEQDFSGVRVTRSLVSCACFVDRCLSFCTFSFGHCIVCSSSIYGIWLPPFGIFKLFLLLPSKYRETLPRNGPSTTTVVQEALDHEKSTCIVRPVRVSYIYDSFVPYHLRTLLTTRLYLQLRNYVIFLLYRTF